ncbi:MAG: PAS domain-containing protein [Sediminicola sp.]
MKQYDKVVNKIYRSQKVNFLPLISWDFFMPHFNAFCMYQYDLDILTGIGNHNHWSSAPKFREALQEEGKIIVLTDANLRILHASKNISEMNGYAVKEIIGKQPKMFQGKGTDPETISYISNAVRQKLPFETTILNYRKDGSPYLCHIKAEPLFDELGKVVNFVAFEKEVA